MSGLATPPSTPKAPAKQRGNLPSVAGAREPIPHELLIPAGTIRLHAVVATSTAQAVGKWQDLAAESLSPVETASPAELPLLTPKKPRKRGQAPSAHLLHDILAAQNACLLEASFQADSSTESALVRIYLVPSDDQALWTHPTFRARKARPRSASWLRVLENIEPDDILWQHGFRAPSTSRHRLTDEPHKTLLEVYQNISSPRSDESWVNELECSDAVQNRLREALWDDPWGLASDLYTFQKASFAKMLALEQAPRKRSHPSYQLYNSVMTVHCCSYWLSTVGDVRRSPPMVVNPRGGILAEEMGTGKTAICLALVLSTLGQLPEVPTEVSPMTSSSLEFPFDREATEREQLKQKLPEPLVGYEPTALEEAQYAAALAIDQQLHAVEISYPLPSLKAMLLSYLRTSRNRSRYSQHDAKLRASGLTDELDRQVPFYYIHPTVQQRESREGRRGAVQSCKVVIAPTTLVVVPSLLVKQWCDEIEKHVEAARTQERPTIRTIVLRTSKDPFPTPEELTRCDLLLMSSARFSDAADDPQTCIRRVHFKRAIIDEGHTLGSSQSRMQKLASQLLSESKWAITGTPSTNLRGSLEEGESSLFVLDATVGGDAKDFERLGRIYSSFLGHPAFPKVANWRELFAEPMLERGRGAARLQRLFDDTIIRTQPAQVKHILKLPPMHSQVVYLQMNDLERKTYNALLAFFTVNSILTQRSDLDYLFHENNRMYLNVLATNLAASSFFFSSDEILWRTGNARDTSRTALETDRCAHWSDEDKESMRKAVLIFDDALLDPEWLPLMRTQTAGLSTFHMPEAFKQTFQAVSSDGDRSLVPTTGLVYLRRAIKAVRDVEQAIWKDSEDLFEEVVSHEEKRLWAELNPEEAQKQEEANATPVKKKKRKAPELADLKQLPRDSGLDKVLIGTTSSSKLNYVVSQLRKHADDKFIIFSSTLPDLIFSVLSETLDLLGMPHAILAGQGRGRDRGATVAWFNTSTAAECRCILIDAKLGGRGLNLIAANRIIMLEPIWNADLEMQAAKRAHRLGQTKDCFMEILVIESSYEHELLKRRSQLSQTALTATKAPQTDEKLKDVLQSAAYLPPSHDSSLIRLEPVRLLHDDMFKEVPSAEPVSDAMRPDDEPADVTATQLATPSPSPVKKKQKKMVAFVEID